MDKCKLIGLLTLKNECQFAGILRETVLRNEVSITLSSPIQGNRTLQPNRCFDGLAFETRHVSGSLIASHHLPGVLI